MAEIHRLNGVVVEAAGAAGDADVIAQLEWMLERARTGKIVAFAAVMRDGDTIGTVQRGIWRGGFFEAIGALAILQIDMSNGALAGPPDD